MRLEITNENGQKEVFSTEKREFVIGRSPKCDIAVKSESISRRHLSLELINNKIFLYDLGSANGTFVNGEKLDPKVPTEWKTFFVIQLGHKVSVTYLPEEDKRESSINYIDPIIRRSDYRKNNQEKNEKFSQRAKAVPLKKSTKENSFSGLIIGAIISATAIYYFLGGSIPFLKPKEGELAESKKEKMAANHQFALSNLQNVISKNKCTTEEEKMFCQLLNYSFSKGEGVVIDNDNLYLVLDFYQHSLGTTFKVNLLNMKDEARVEFLMLMVGFDNQLKGAVLNAGLGNLIIVNINSTYRQVTSAYELPQANMNKLSPLDIQTVFKQFMKNNFTLYNAVMKPLLKWGN